MSFCDTLLAAVDFAHPLGTLDWIIILTFLVATTAIAFLTKGRQQDVRDFFLANRDLPWIVVCLSLMASEISAASYMGVPAFAYQDSLVYLQLAIGAILARFIIGYYVIPSFYEGEIYSPYQMMGNKLGLGAERMTSFLFVVGAVVGQGARVFILGKVLETIAGIPILNTIIAISAFAALWAVIGGIRTVVWTGAVQFVILLLGCLATLVYLIAQADGGVSGILGQAYDANKLRLFDLRFDHVLELTLWTGIFGSTFNTLASHGADQMNAQRLFCCRSAGDARKAVIWSSLTQVVVLLLLFVGLGLYTFIQQRADTEALGLSSDAAYPFFIARALPAGLKGLLIAGILAAAISSLNAALSALAQTTVRWYMVEAQPGPLPKHKNEVHYSRFFTLLWGAVLVSSAWAFQQITDYEDVVTMALKLTSFTYGALVGSLLLALSLKNRNDRGVFFGAPYAVLTAFGMIWHQDWAHYTLLAGVVALFIWWTYTLFQEVERLTTIRDQETYVRSAWYILLAEFPRTFWVLVASVVALSSHWAELIGKEPLGGQFELAWPWYLPMGVGITVVLGYLLSRPVEVRLEK